MVECPICTHGVDPDMPGCIQWRDQPVHVACYDVIAQSLTEFEPVLVDRHHDYDPNHQPVVYSWVGVTFQQYDCNWVKMDDSIKEKMYDQYCHVLEKMLDHQQEVVRAYCKRNGLGEPRFVREIKQEKLSLSELRKLINDQAMKPGDHVVLAVLPRSQHHKHMAAQLTINIAKKLSRRGVTFHSAWVGIDWSKPLSQHIVKMALNMQLWQNTIYRPNIDIGSDGMIFKLDGKKWHELQTDHGYQWIIRHIRDKKMTPRELYIAGSRFWSVYVRCGFKWKCVFISRKKTMATARKSCSHYWCRNHDIVSTTKECPACGRNSQPVKTVMARGVFVNLLTGKANGVDDYVRAWAFYLQYHPEQHKQPWRTRSRFVPENLKLTDTEIRNDPVL